MLSNIWIAVYFFQVTDQVQEFLIVFLSDETTNRHTIIKIKAKGNYGIVNQNYVFKMTILNDSQIFDVHAFCRVYAMLSIKPMLNNLAAFIKIVKNCISISLFTSSENCNFIELSEMFKTIIKKRSHFYTDLDYIIIIAFTIDLHLEVSIVILFLFRTCQESSMYQSLIHIKYKNFVPCRWTKLNKFRFYFLNAWILELSAHSEHIDSFLIN